MRIRILIIGIVCLAILIASHWFAFHRGRKRGNEAHRAFGLQAVAEAEIRQLRASVAILRAMVKHPDRFSEGERFKSQNVLIDEGRIMLAHLKKTGDEARVHEVEALIREGRELSSKLPK